MISLPGLRFRELTHRSLIFKYTSAGRKMSSLSACLDLAIKLSGPFFITLVLAETRSCYAKYVPNTCKQAAVGDKGKQKLVVVTL